jgi:hypothetical protein
MRLPADLDSSDWEMVKQVLIEECLADGIFENRKKAESYDWDHVKEYAVPLLMAGEKFDWRDMIAESYSKREKEFIEYARHHELLTTSGIYANIPPLCEK